MKTRLKLMLTFFLAKYVYKTLPAGKWGLVKYIVNPYLPKEPPTKLPLHRRFYLGQPDVPNPIDVQPHRLDESGLRDGVADELIDLMTGRRLR